MHHFSAFPLHDFALMVVWVFNRPRQGKKIKKEQQQKSKTNYRSLLYDEKHAPIKRTSKLFQFLFLLDFIAAMPSAFINSRRSFLSSCFFSFISPLGRQRCQNIRNPLSIIFQVLWKCLWYLIYWNLHNVISKFMIFILWNYLNLKLCVVWILIVHFKIFSMNVHWR